MAKKQISLYVTQEQYEYYQSVAKRKGLPMNTVIIMLTRVQEKLEQQQVTPTQTKPNVNINLDN